MTAKLLTTALCVATLVPRLAAQVQVQLATAVVYEDQLCTKQRSNSEYWAVNLCSPYPAQKPGSDIEHEWGSVIYEVEDGRLVERRFQSMDCSGREWTRNRLGPVVGGTGPDASRGSCVPVAGSADNIFATSITLTAASRSNFTYRPVFSDKGCSTSYGVYMLSGPIRSECTVAPAGQIPRGVPSTTKAYLPKCDSSDVYMMCTYDSATCSGKPNQCRPFSEIEPSCSNRGSNWGSMYVWRGPTTCPGKVPAVPSSLPVSTSSPTMSSSPLTCLDVKRMYQEQKCCEDSSLPFRWSPSFTSSTQSTSFIASGQGTAKDRRLSDIPDIQNNIENVLSMVQAENGKESAREVALELIKLAETFTVN